MRTVIIAVVASLCFVTLAFCQTDTATISGRVADPSGAAVAGAEVHIQNVLTGQDIPIKTNSSGLYVATALQPGRYRIIVSNPGFKQIVKPDVVLNVQDNISINFAMAIGSTSESVTVEAGAEMVHTESAELGQTINEHSITELPLNGRNPASLVLLTPGATDILITPAGAHQSYTTFPTETAASINGSRQGGTYYLLDGAYNIDNYQLTAAPFPNPDATQEFNVIGNNFDPRYGFTFGGVVSIVTKSGTNQWHGNAFEFLRNGALNSKEYFTRQTDNIKRNQFGASIGGPLIKDKLFIFGNYQGTRQRSDVNSSETYVPSDAMRAGDFSALCHSGFDVNGICNDRDPSNPSLVTGQVWHPSIAADHSFVNAVANAYPNDFIDPATFDSAAVQITNLLPHSTDPLGHLVSQGYANISDFDEATVRTDYNINDHQRVSGRAFLNYFRQPAYSATLLSSNRSWIVNWQNYAGTYTWTLNPHMVNNLTGSYSRMFSTSDTGLKVNGHNFCLSQYINGVNDTSPGAPCGLYLLDVSGGPGGGFGVGANFNAINRWTWGVSDSLSISKGKHLIAVGFDLLKQYWYLNATIPPLAIFTGGPNGSFTGYGFSDFLLGQLGYFGQGAGLSNEIHATMVAPYFADQIKLTSHLTLTAGVRWEPFLAPYPSSGRQAIWAPGQHSTRYPNAPDDILYIGDAGVPSAGLNNSYNNFDPRVGLAWQPKALPNTSIRVAAGIYSTPIDYSHWNGLAQAPPFSPSYSYQAGTPQTPTVTTPIIPFDNPWSVYQPTGGVSPFPPFPGPGSTPGPTAAILTPVGFEGFDRHWRPGTTQTWNLSVEHQFGQNWLARAAYVGSESYHQDLQIETDPGLYNADPALNGQRPFQNFSSVDLLYANGTANYQSGQFTLERRFAHGLQFQANYTYSKDIDETSSGAVGIDNPLCVRCNRGNSWINTPQVFVANFIYETPSLSGWNASTRAVLGGWEVSGIYRAQSGLQFQVWSGLDQSASHLGTDHASFAPGNHVVHSHPGSLDYLDYTDFVQPDPGSFGTVGRAPASGPGVNTWDLGLDKNFRINERYRIQFRWEMFNAFNRTDFARPERYLTEGPDTFGHIFSTSSDFPPRTMQAALKLYF